MSHGRRCPETVFRWCVGATAFAVVCFSAAGGAVAQEPSRQPDAIIVGRVTDTLGAPLPYCFVRLENGQSAVLCDSTGHFRLAGLGHNLTTFEVRRLGYVPGRFTAMVVSDSMQFTIQLAPVRTILRPIRVTAAAVPDFSPWLTERGFYRRMREGLTGMFITPEELERLKPQRVTEVLQDRPGIKIVYRGGLANELIPYVWGRNNCLLNVFVDGIEIRGVYALDPKDLGYRRGGVSFYGSPGFRGLGVAGPPSQPVNDLGIDAFILPRNIAAIEIYPSGPTTPIEFRTTNECGAIVIWTKVGTRPATEDSVRVRPAPPDTTQSPL